MKSTKDVEDKVTLSEVLKLIASVLLRVIIYGLLLALASLFMLMSFCTQAELIKLIVHPTNF